MKKIFLLMTIVFWIFSARAEETTGRIFIKVGDANLKRSLLALPSLQYLGTPGLAKNNLKAGKDLFDTLNNDLLVSGYFEFIKPAAFLEDVSKVGLKPVDADPGGFKFDSWKKIGTEFLIRAGYKILGSELTFETYLYYVPQAKVLVSKSYKADIKDARFVAHTFANDVVKELTGQRGMFLTKLVVTRTTNPQQKEIFIMDWDGQNSKQITFHKSISLSPAWAPDGKTIAYTQFAFHPKERSRNADLFSYELNTGKRWLLSFQKGINSGATFHPNGSEILFTLSSGGNPDIYRMNNEGKNLKKITDGPKGSMNVEPSVSPDGKKIAFSSDRSGQPMVYIMNYDGSDPKRVTFAGDYNSTPRFSPDGTKLVFAGYDKGHFDLFLMNSDGTNMIRLTSAKKPSGKGANNEEPSFSPDGQHILFASDRSGKKQLYLTDLQGENEHRITFDNFDYFRPAWGPFEN